MSDDSASRHSQTLTQCPYCKEEIAEGAVICPHCRSRLQANQPSHGGTCPYCKEAIDEEAVRCKHCGSFVGASGSTGGTDPGFRASSGSSVAGTTPAGISQVTAPVRVTPGVTPMQPGAAAAFGRGGLGGVGGGGLGIWCTGHWSCYPCTRCIPFTDYCWESTCCDLVGIDCGF